MVLSVYYKKGQKTTIHYVFDEFPNFYFHLLDIFRENGKIQKELFAFKGENPNLKGAQS